MARTSNRRAVLEALKQGVANDQIEAREYFKVLVIASLFPRLFNQAANRIVESALESLPKGHVYGDLSQLENLIKLLIEYLPQIMELIETIFNLFNREKLA